VRRDWNVFFDVESSSESYGISNVTPDNNHLPVPVHVHVRVRLRHVRHSSVSSIELCGVEGTGYGSLRAMLLAPDWGLAADDVCSGVLCGVQVVEA